MDEFRMFIGFFWKALKSLPRNPTAIVFGALLTGSSVEFFGSLLEEGGPFERYRSTITDMLMSHPLFILAIPIILAVTTFAKSGLILALSEKNASIKNVGRRVLGIFPRIYMLEILYLISVLIILVALLLPAILTRDTPSLGLNLALLGLVIFLPISLVLTFVEIYAFFYLLLPKVPLRVSIELGYALFMKRAATSIVFGAVSILVLIAASLIIGTVLGFGNAFMPDSPGRMIIVVIILFFMQSALVIVQKGAWLSFFRFIGAEKNSMEIQASQKEGNVVQKEVPEIG
jgi:hypothetical protein